MKVKIQNYPSRLTCNTHTNYMTKKYGYYVDCDKEQTKFENCLEWCDGRLQNFYNIFNRLWFDRRQQKVSVHIDPWDTWSMDCTLAPIIIPMLIQLKKTKHGAPYVYPEDVPDKLRPTNDFDRWDYVLDEMIWAFEQKCRDHWEQDYYGPYNKGKDETFGFFEWTDDKGREKHQQKMSNGFRLFGKYYENLWD
jgi:hypothetical protein